MISFDKFKEVISKAQNIGLTYHINPDGDAIGSLLAMKFMLEKIGKNVTIFSKDNLKENFLNFLSGIEEIDEQNYIVKDIDVLIIVDCGNKERVSCEYNDIITIGIDHHISNEKYCTYNFINPLASSTGEIVYDIIQSMNVDMDATIAKCIYTSILTDTGGLRFDCATQKTFNIVGELVSTGINFPELYEKMFLTKTYGKVKLLGLVYNNLKMIDNKISIVRITDSMLKECSVDESQTGDIVNTGLMIEGALVSILIKNFNNKTKVSLRSKDNINVCEIAKGFGGGGHIKASAFVTDLSMDEIEEVLIRKFKEIING